MSDEIPVDRRIKELRDDVLHSIPEDYFVRGDEDGLGTENGESPMGLESLDNQYGMSILAVGNDGHAHADFCRFALGDPDLDRYRVIATSGDDMSSLRRRVPPGQHGPDKFRAVQRRYATRSATDTCSDGGQSTGVVEEEALTTVDAQVGKESLLEYIRDVSNAIDDLAPFDNYTRFKPGSLRVCLDDIGEIYTQHEDPEFVTQAIETLAIKVSRARGQLHVHLSEDQQELCRRLESVSEVRVDLTVEAGEPRQRWTVLETGESQSWLPIDYRFELSSEP